MKRLRGKSMSAFEKSKKINSNLLKRPNMGVRVKYATTSSPPPRQNVRHQFSKYKSITIKVFLKVKVIIAADYVRKKNMYLGRCRI